MIKSPSSLFWAGAGDTKRAMIGEPHALPYITSGEIDQEDDTIFASRSSFIFIILSESAAPNHKISLVPSSFSYRCILQPSLRRPLLEPSLQSLGLATAIIGATFASKWAFKCEALVPFYLFTKRAKTEIFLYQSFPSLQRRWWVRIPRLWSNRTSQGGEVTRKSPLHLNNKVPNAPFRVPPSTDETISHRRPPLPVTGSWLSPHRCITIRWENLGQLWDLITWMNNRHYEPHN